jgi:formiminoglutamase
MSNPPAGLSTDPLWPRAGGWPRPDQIPGNKRIDVALVGIPASQTSLSATNAHETPDAIRAALYRYSPALMQDRGALDKNLRTNSAIVDLEDLTVADFGNVTDPDSPAGEARSIALMADAAKASELVIALGGDNSITVASALGVWGSELETAGLITLDAHYDLRDGVSNGSPVRRLIEAGINPERIVQIGIQDFANSVGYARRAQDLGITVIHRDELQRRPMSDVMAEALSIAGSAGGPIHVDLDVDVCDRAVAPACPASVPGGISAYELRQAARAAGMHSQVHSIDVAEIDSTMDAPDGRTVRLAALCVLEAIAGLSQR